MSRIARDVSNASSAEVITRTGFPRQGEQADRSKACAVHAAIEPTISSGFMRLAQEKAGTSMPRAHCSMCVTLSFTGSSAQ
jgi:hypothetical protein